MVKVYVLELAGKSRSTGKIEKNIKILKVKRWPDLLGDMYNYMNSRYEKIYSVRSEFSMKLTLLNLLRWKRMYERASESIRSK